MPQLKILNMIPLKLSHSESRIYIMNLNMNCHNMILSFESNWFTRSYSILVIAKKPTLNFWHSDYRTPTDEQPVCVTACMTHDSLGQKEKQFFTHCDLTSGFSFTLTAKRGWLFRKFVYAFTCIALHRSKAWSHNLVRILV